MEIKLLRQPYKYLKKAKKSLRQRITRELKLLQEHPMSGTMLKGRLKGIRSHKFKEEGTNYRIAYKLEEDVLIILIATRENFYRDIRL